MKLTCCGVTFSAAITRSPSASSLSPETSTTMRAARIWLKASSNTIAATSFNLRSSILAPSDPLAQNLSSGLSRDYRQSTFRSHFLRARLARFARRFAENFSLDHQIGSDLGHAQRAEPNRVAHRVRDQAFDRRQAAAEDERGDEEHDAIDDARVECGTGQMRPA